MNLKCMYVCIPSLSVSVRHCMYVFHSHDRWPDAYLGITLVLDHLSENTMDEDVVRLNRRALSVIKEIAANKSWPNNPTCGKLTFYLPA